MLPKKLHFMVALLKVFFTAFQLHIWRLQEQAGLLVSLLPLKKTDTLQIGEAKRFYV